MSVLNERDREQILSSVDDALGPAWNASNKPLQISILRVLASIDARLERMEKGQ